MNKSELDDFFGRSERRGRRRLGVVGGGSLSTGIDVRLDVGDVPGGVIEDLAVGKYVVIEGATGRTFFSLITDIALGHANPELALNPPMPEDAYSRDIYARELAFGRVNVAPMLLLEEGAKTPKPVKTIPAHFSVVYEASAEDVDAIFGEEDATHFHIRSGNGVCCTSNNGPNYTVKFLQTGTVTLSASILINGCSTPKIIQKDFNVQPHRIVINGSSQICNTAVYTITGLSLNENVVWNTSRHLSIINGQNTHEVTVTKLSSSSAAYIEATITSCNIPLTIRKSGIKVGTQSPLIKIYNENGTQELGDPYYTGVNYTMVAYGEGTYAMPSYNFDWLVTPPSSCNDCFSSMYNGWSFPFTAESSGDYVFALKFYNASECGWSDQTSKSFYFQEGENLFRLYPNPAFDIVTVEINSNNQKLKKSKESDFEDFEIELWNQSNGLVKKITKSMTVNQISLQGLNKGLYFVLLKKDDKIVQRKILQVK